MVGTEPVRVRIGTCEIHHTASFDGVPDVIKAPEEVGILKWL
jgi:hypothetical protein